MGNLGLKIENVSQANNKETVEKVQNEIKTDTEQTPQKFNENEEKEEFLNKEYTNNRIIIVSLTNNYSYYRKANDKVLNERNEYIGSCTATSIALTSNKSEMDSYFPSLIGVNPNNENYITKVKEYLNNIQVKVNKLGVKFDASFVYNHYRDYLSFKRKEDAINAKYDAIDKSNTKLLKKGLDTKIKELNILESEQHKYGHPVNVADYILYRHCLLYNDIAKETALINNNKNVRFYIKDEEKEIKLQESLRDQLNKAKKNYIALCENENLFEDAYIQYCVIKNMPVLPSLAESIITKMNNLDKFSQDEPVKFNKICNDKNIKVKSLIEKLIANGILSRHPHSQNIVSADGNEYIGANMNEAVLWFNNVNNTSIVEGYKNKLNYI